MWGVAFSCLAESFGLGAEVRSFWNKARRRVSTFIRLIANVHVRSRQSIPLGAWITSVVVGVAIEDRWWVATVESWSAVTLGNNKKIHTARGDILAAVSSCSTRIQLASRVRCRRRGEPH